MSTENMLGFQKSTSAQKTESAMVDASETILEIAERLKQLDLLEGQEESIMNKEIEDKIDRLLNSIEQSQNKKATPFKEFMREHGVGLFISVLLILIGSFVVGGFSNLGDDIDKVNGTLSSHSSSISSLETSVDYLATKEDLANMRTEANAKIDELRLQFSRLNSNLESLIDD